MNIGFNHIVESCKTIEDLKELQDKVKRANGVEDEKR